MNSIWIALFLAIILPQVAAAAPTLAGTARIDITPSIDMKAPLGGFGDRMSRPATGVHDRIWAKALVVRESDRRFALVTADVLFLPPGFKAAVMERLAIDGWKPEQVLLLPSHSHSSISDSAINPRLTFGTPQVGYFDEKLFRLTVDRFASVIRDADRSREACRVGTASIDLQGWNRNRRRNKELETELTVTRVDTAHGPLAVLVNWTAHPTFMGSDNMMFSGDWPGQMQRTVEALVGEGATALYYNGAEGDQTYVARPDSGVSWERPERYGREIGIKVWQVWRSIHPNRAPALAYTIEPIALPKRTWHPDFMATGGTEYGLNEKTIALFEEQMVPEATHSISVRLGDLVIAGVPGEAAAVLGDQIKSRARAALGMRHVVVGGLADEWIGYLLSPEEYRKGGYEASMSFYGEEAGPTVVDGVARGAARLR